MKGQNHIYFEWKKIEVQVNSECKYIVGYNQNINWTCNFLVYFVIRGIEI